MEIRYSLTPEHAAAFVSRELGRSSTFQLKMRLVRFGFGGAFLATGIFFSWQHGTWEPSVFGTVMAAFWAWWYPRRIVRIHQNLARKSYKASLAESPSAVHTIALTNGKLRLETGGQKTSFRLDKIERIDDDGQFVSFVFVKDPALTLPHEAVLEGDLAEFVAETRRRISDGN